MYVRVYGADMVCRLIETCFLIHILRSISKVLGASSFCTCVEYIMLGLVLFHSDFFFFFFFSSKYTIYFTKTNKRKMQSIPNAEFVKITYRQGNTAAGPSFYCRECLFKTRATS